MPLSDISCKSTATLGPILGRIRTKQRKSLAHDRKQSRVIFLPSLYFQLVSIQENMEQEGGRIKRMNSNILYNWCLFSDTKSVHLQVFLNDSLEQAHGW